MARVRCKTCSTINPSGRTTCVHCNGALPRVSIQIGQAPNPAPQHVHFEKGQVVAGRYTVLDLVGKGGMGCIYKVHDNVLGEDVALKTLLPQFAQDRVVVDRFFNEAKITRRLSHPNIVRVHDIGSADGVIYISMEFLDGDSLRGVMEKAGQAGRLPLEYVFGVMDRLCSALEYAHKYTVHRDIKPENVMVTKDGTVKLMDFGISKLMASQGLTGNAMVMGTPMYMPPEQLRDSGNVDARADLFSIGVMLYEMLTGHLPTGIPKPASQLYPDVPEVMDDIVAQCVAQRPENRYADVKVLRKTLRDSQHPQQKAPAAPQHARLAQAGGGGTRKVLGMVLAAGVCGLVVAGLVLAEKRRAALPEAAAQARTSAAVALLRERAAAAAETLPEAQRALYDAAERRWETVASGDAAGAPGRAEAEALQFYLGALLLEDGMQFVPPGEVITAAGVGYVPAFLIDESEVTVADFERFVQASSWRMPASVRGIESRYANFPIISVTWYDALAFAAAAGKTLPTSVQWSRAAANGDGIVLSFPWGVEWERDGANAAQGGAGKGAQPVMSFERDRVEASGCYDLAGNVSEWTRSTKSGDFAALDFGTEMIVRGGSYLIPPRKLTAEMGVACEEARADIGFRCVRELPTHDAALREILAALP